MLQTICNYLSNQLISTNIITKEEQIIYNYGIYLILMTIITSGTILISGVFLEKIILTIIFLFVLVSMRHYAGGYHANAYWKCYLLSCLSYYITMYFTFNVKLQRKMVLLVLMVIVMLYNIKIGSLNSDKNPKTEKEMIIRKKRARYLFLLYGVISIIGILFDIAEITIWLVMVWGQVIVMIALLSQQINRRYLRWKLKRQY